MFGKLKTRCNYSAYQNQSIDADLAEMDASYCNLVKKEKRDHQPAVKENSFMKFAR